MRRPLVAIDFELLRNAREAAIRGSVAVATLNQNLFEDIAFTGIVERAEPTSSGYEPLGRIREVGPGTIVPVINEGVVAGMIRTPGRHSASDRMSWEPTLSAKLTSQSSRGEQSQ